MKWLKALLECDGNFSGATMSAFIKIPDFVVPDQDNLRKRGPSIPSQDAPTGKKLLDIGVFWFPGHVRRSFKVCSSVLGEITAWLKTIEP